VVQGGGVALEVHGDHRVPLALIHPGDERVPQDAGVVHQHVESAELTDRLVDQGCSPVPGGDVVGVGHCLTTGSGDLLDHLLRGTGVGTGAVIGATEVVDDHTGPLAGEQ